MRPATGKERASIAAIRRPDRREAVFVCVMLTVGATLFLAVAYALGALALGVVAVLLMLLTAALAFKRAADERHEMEAMLVEETSGPIEKVDRVKGIVSAIHVRGRRYTILDAEPVSEGTKVRIAFLPTSWRVVSLERIYDARP